MLSVLLILYSCTQVCTQMVLNTYDIGINNYEQRTENPCVGGSIPPLGTIFKAFLKLVFYEHS